jgi:hypothetical protein
MTFSNFSKAIPVTCSKKEVTSLMPSGTFPNSESNTQSSLSKDLKCHTISEKTIHK